MGQSATSRDTTDDPILLLEKLRTEVYEGSTDELALGLGRPTNEIERWFDGTEEIDEDAEFKIRRLSDERLRGE